MSEPSKTVLAQAFRKRARKWLTELIDPTDADITSLSMLLLETYQSGADAAFLAGTIEEREAVMGWLRGPWRIEVPTLGTLGQKLADTIADGYHRKGK